MIRVDEKHAPEVEQQLCSLVLVGLGVIGSFAAPLLSSLPGVRTLLLVDPDRYDESNVGVQNISSLDVGKPKAEVQAGKLLAINPRLRTEAVVDRVENLPRGMLRGHELLVGAVDSRAARQHLNEISVRLGLPYVDAGVEGGQRIAGVSIFVPGEGRPCLECTWSEHDYRAIEQRYPCQDSVAPRPSGASAELGALAAALLAMECRRLLPGDRALAAGGIQIVQDAAHHHVVVSTVRRLESCRLPHGSIDPEVLDRGPADLSLGDLMALASPGARGGNGCGVRVEGSFWACGVVCSRCGFSDAALRLGVSLEGARGACPRCKARLVVPGSARRRVLEESEISGEVASMRLSGLCVRDREIVGVQAGESVRWFELRAGAVGG